MKKWEEQTDSFLALGEDAAEYTILVFTTYMQLGDGLETEVKPHPIKRLATSDGDDVTQVNGAKGVYQLVYKPWIKLTSEAPNAI